MIKRVLIEAEKATRRRMQGTQRYVRHLLAELQKLEPTSDSQLSVLIGGEIRQLEGLDLSSVWARTDLGRDGVRRDIRRALIRLERIPGVAAARRRLGRRRISAAARRRWASAAPFDLVHLTSPHSYRSLAGLPSRLVATVHDLTHRQMPEVHLRQTIDSTEEGLSFIAGRARGAIAVSEATRRDFLALYEFRQDRVRVVRHGVDQERFSARSDPQAEAAVRAKHGLRGPFALALATIEPRKNIEGLLRAWSRMRSEHSDVDARLVIAGRAGWKAEAILDQIRSAAESGIKAIGFIDDQELPALLRAATCFCYVSHYEGFGLPLLEAMSCGTPVIYGDNSSMPEVVGSAGLGVPTRDVDAIAGALGQLLRDSALRDRLSLLAVERASRFSWERTARKTLEFYRELW